MNTNNPTPISRKKVKVYSVNIYELLKHIRKQTISNLLGHNCEVTALPEGAESWFSGLDSILPEEVKVESKRWKATFKR